MDFEDMLPREYIGLLTTYTLFKLICKILKPNQ